MSGPSSTSRVVEVRADGSVVLEVVVSPAPILPPVDPPVPGPWLTTKVRAIRANGVSYPLAGLNPPDGGTWPGGRGPDQLVAYQAPRARTGTNQFGVTVPVIDGVAGTAVIGIADVALPAGADGVLSGHGRAADWLLSNAFRGATIEALEDLPEPLPPDPALSVPTIAVYVMDGVGRMSQVPPEVNQARTAFLQGSSLVEWGGDTPAQHAAAVTAWCAADARRRHLISLGGEHGSVTLGTVVPAVNRIGQAMPVHGVDWDIEGGALDVAAAVRISRELAAGRPDWVTSFVPPGGAPVAVYLEAAAQCQAAGLKVQFGQQLYMTKVDEATVLKQLGIAVARLGAPSVLLGVMLGTDPRYHSTPAQAAQYLRAAVAKWPTFGGAYLWESARPGTAVWARDAAAILG